MGAIRFSQFFAMIPLVVFAVIVYILVVSLGGGGPGVEGALATLNKQLFRINLLRGAPWTFTWGDLILILAVLLLFVELIKSTSVGKAVMVDHALSLIVFVGCLLVFLVWEKAATTPFFLLVLTSLIDVSAGFMIGMVVARRGITLGSPNE